MKNIFDYADSLSVKPTNKKETYYSEYVDIYDFFDKLLMIFREQGVINDSVNEDEHLNEKFVFLEEYPDELANHETTYVVYGIGERSFWNERGTGVHQPKVAQLAPRTLKTKFDLVQNGIVEDKAYMFENIIRLEIFHKSLKRVLQVAQLVESLMLKHKGKLKLYVHDVVYVGQTPTEFSSAYFERRLFSRSLIFRVITYSPYSLVTEEIKYVNGEMVNK